RVAVTGAGERGAGAAAVVVHAGDQLVDAGKLHLGADPGNEHHVDGDAVEIVGNVEQVDLKQRSAVVEGRTPAEARHPVVDAPGNADPHRVDALLEPALRIKPQVGGR